MLRRFVAANRTIGSVTTRALATTANSIPRYNGSTATPELMVKALREQGACIVENWADPKTIDTINGELAPYLGPRRTIADGERAGIEQIAKFSGYKTKRMLGILGKAPSLSALAADELVLSTVEQLLIPYYCQSIILHIGLIRRLCPGESAQPLHQDRHSVPVMRMGPAPGEEGYFPGFQWGVNAIWALTDCTEENGATSLVPYSHLSETPAEVLDVTIKVDGREQKEKALKDEPNAVVATMPAGSLLMYNSCTVHCAGANKTESEERDVCLFGYSPGWIRQEEAMLLTTPPEVVRKLPQRVQELIGYHLHGAVLGMVDTGYDYGHPRTMLEEKEQLPKLSDNNGFGLKSLDDSIKTASIGQ